MTLELLDNYLLKRTLPVTHDTEELSLLELLAKVTQKVNDAVKVINDFNLNRDSDKAELLQAIDDVQIALNQTISQVEISKVSVSDLEDNRMLSATGDFTGTIGGKDVASIFTDISDSLSLSQTIINMINNNESIGTIYDGGYFVDTDPVTLTVEGGEF